MKLEIAKQLKHRMVIYDLTNGDIYTVSTPQNAFITNLNVKCAFVAGVRVSQEEMKNIPKEITINDDNVSNFEVISYANLAITDPHVRASLAFINVQLQSIFNVARG